MRCSRCRDQLVGYLYDELAPKREAQVESHLEQCAGCRQALAEMRFALAASRQAPRPVPERIPTQKIVAAARRVHPPRPSWWRTLVRRPALAGAVGMLFVGAVLYVQFQHRDRALEALSRPVVTSPAPAATPGASGAVVDAVAAKAGTEGEVAAGRLSQERLSDEALKLKYSDYSVSAPREILPEMAAADAPEGRKQIPPPPSVRIPETPKTNAPVAPVLGARTVDNPADRTLQAGEPTILARETKMPAGPARGAELRRAGLQKTLAATSEAAPAPVMEAFVVAAESREKDAMGRASLHELAQQAERAPATPEVAALSSASPRLFNFYSRGDGVAWATPPDLGLAQRLLTREDRRGGSAGAAERPAIRFGVPAVASMRQASSPRIEKSEAIRDATASALHARAQQLLLAEKYVEAASEYRILVQDFPNDMYHDRVLVEFGHALQRSGNLLGALKMLREARKTEFGKSLPELDTAIRRLEARIGRDLPEPAQQPR